MLEELPYGTQTKFLVSDYIYWRLNKDFADLNLKISTASSTIKELSNPTKTHQALCGKTKFSIREMTYQFEQIYAESYSSLLTRLDDDHLLSIPLCKHIFFSVAFEILQLQNVNNRRESTPDGFGVRHGTGLTRSYAVRRNGREGLSTKILSRYECNWGRVVAVFALAGMLATRLARAHKCDRLGWQPFVRECVEWLSQLLINDKRVSKWIQGKGNGWNGLLEYQKERKNKESKEDMSWLVHRKMKIADAAADLYSTDADDINNQQNETTIARSLGDNNVFSSSSSFLVKLFCSTSEMVGSTIGVIGAFTALTVFVASSSRRSSFFTVK